MYYYMSLATLGNCPNIHVFVCVGVCVWKCGRGRERQRRRQIETERQEEKRGREQRGGEEIKLFKESPGLGTEFHMSIVGNVKTTFGKMCKQTYDVEQEHQQIFNPNNKINSECEFVFSKIQYICSH